MATASTKGAGMTGDGQRWWRFGRTTTVVRWLVVAAAALMLLVLFIADNFVVIEVRVFTIHTTARLAWVLLLTFSLGALSGIACYALWRWRR
jgi:hypothetical protein